MAGIGFPISAVSGERAVVYCNHNAVMSSSMTNRPKPVSTARIVTKNFNQYSVQLPTWTYENSAFKMPTISLIEMHKHRDYFLVT